MTITLNDYIQMTPTITAHPEESLKRIALMFHDARMYSHGKLILMKIKEFSAKGFIMTIIGVF